MWMMLQKDIADDYVLATGKTYSVRHFIDLAFAEVGIKMDWKGEGINEKGINSADGKVLVEIDEKYFRPTEVELLIGDPTKAHRELGWKHTVELPELVSEMVKADLDLFQRDKLLSEGGHKVMNYHE
jgi:GDPmannose 4,6-dehydratase